MALGPRRVFLSVEIELAFDALLGRMRGISREVGTGLASDPEIVVGTALLLLLNWR